MMGSQKNPATQQPANQSISKSWNRFKMARGCVRRGQDEGRQQVLEVRTLLLRSTERGKELPPWQPLCFLHVFHAGAVACSIGARNAWRQDCFYWVCSLWARGEVFGWLCHREERAPRAALQCSSSESWKGEMRCCLLGSWDWRKRKEDKTVLTV